MSGIGSHKSTAAKGLGRNRRVPFTQWVPVVFVAILSAITYTELGTSVALGSSGNGGADSTVPYVLGESVTNPPEDTESVFIEAARPRLWHERVSDGFQEAFGNLAPWAKAAIVSGVASALLLGSMAVVGQLRERRERRELW